MWTAQTVLPVNLSRHTAFLTGSAGTLQTPYIAVTGGRTAVPADMTTTYESQDQATGAVGASWNSGVVTLTSGNLGTGGAITNNQDGTQTITWAYVFLIHERMQRHGRDQGWQEFVDRNADLFDWKDNILKSFYQDETLSSERARRTFVFPDRKHAR